MLFSILPYKIDFFSPPKAEVCRGNYSTQLLSGQIESTKWTVWLEKILITVAYMPDMSSCLQLAVQKNKHNSGKSSFSFLL